MKSVKLPVLCGEKTEEREFQLKKLTPKLRTELAKVYDKFSKKMKSGVDINREYVENIGLIPEEAITSLLVSQMTNTAAEKEALSAVMEAAVGGIMFDLYSEVFKSVVITDGVLAEGESIDWDDVEEELTTRVGKFFRGRNTASRPAR